MKHLKLSSFIGLFLGLAFMILFPFKTLLQASNDNQKIKVSSFTSEIRGTDIVISAELSDEEGSFLPGVEVTFQDINGHSHMTVTNAEGRFQIRIDRSLLSEQIHLKVTIPGFTLSEFSYDLPSRVEYRAEMPPDIPLRVSEDEEPCPNQIRILKNGQGIDFETGGIVGNDESNAYDVYFNEEFLFAKRKSGGIATVGNMGNANLCDINYPEVGYCDKVKIIEKYVYMYESYKKNLRAEIRILSVNKNNEVNICYHVTKY